MDVIFEPQRGRSFSIEVGFFDTVLEIKEKIQKYQNIPISKQTLVFNGQVLQDDGDIASCELLQNSRVQLHIAQDHHLQSPIEIEDSIKPSNKKIQLKIKIPISSKAHISIEIDINDTVGTLKEKIQEMESIPLNLLVLYYCGNELQDHRTLCDYEVSDNAEIDVIFRHLPPTVSAVTTTMLPMTTMAVSGGGGSKKLKLTVLPKCGTRKIPVEVNASDNVGELRKELQKLHQRLNFNLPLEGYFFIYKQNVMDDGRSFRWHHVGQGDTIEIFNGSVTGGS